MGMHHIMPCPQSSVWWSFICVHDRNVVWWSRRQSEPLAYWLLYTSVATYRFVFRQDVSVDSLNSIYIDIYLFICLFIYLFIYLIYLIYSFIYNILWRYIYSMCLSIIYPSIIHLSIHPRAGAPCHGTVYWPPARLMCVRVRFRWWCDPSMTASGVMRIGVLAWANIRAPWMPWIRGAGLKKAQKKAHLPR